MRRSGAVLLAAMLTAAACTATSDDAARPSASDTTAPASAPSEASPTTGGSSDVEPAPTPAQEVSEELGRGINFGNSLEAPREGDWGVGLDESYFEIVAEAGFDHVRLPVSWAGYTDPDPPYTIRDGDDPTVDHPDYRNIWERVDWAIDMADRHGLLLIVNMHHDDAANADPEGHEERLVAMWTQIAERYADAGDHVVFELFNEPHRGFSEDPERWNTLVARLLSAVRVSNPDRVVLVGPVDYNSIDRLHDLVLPDDDRVIATVHVYEPFDFTHQGAPWVDPPPPTDVDWPADRAALADGVLDRSWETTIGPEGSALRIDFDGQWSGLGIELVEPLAPVEVQIEMQGSADLRVSCRTPAGDNLEQTTFSTSAERSSYSLDVSGCPGDSTGISLMNTATTFDPLLISRFTLCGIDRCADIVETSESALRSRIERAAEWGRANGVPVHIGEFGVYAGDGAVSTDERAEWTEVVVDAAIDQGMPYSYWEFHSEFFAYDLERREWVPELRTALLDERAPAD